MKGNIILGVLAGLSLGAVLGVLMAPDKGSVTRKKLKRSGDEYYEDLQEKIDELKDKYQELMDKMTQRVDTAKELMKTGASFVDGKTSKS